MQEQLELLDGETHGALHMHRLGGPHPHMVQIVVGEVERAANSCPVVLVKSAETGRFSLAALFGFAPGEVLVDGADSGQMPFVPLELVRQGFYAVEQSIAVDLAHPRFAAGGPIALFEAHGEPTAQMRAVQKAIGQLMAMGPPTEAFIEAIVNLKLVEPIDVQLQFDDGSNIALNGLYTISGDAMSALGDIEVIRLFRNGWLQTALAMRGSLHQIGLLARRKNESAGSRASGVDKALAGWA